MTPKEAIDTLTTLAANADAQRDTARLEYVMPILFMNREAIDFDMGGGRK